MPSRKNRPNKPQAKSVQVQVGPSQVQATGTPWCIWREPNFVDDGDDFSKKSPTVIRAQLDEEGIMGALGRVYPIRRPGMRISTFRALCPPTDPHYPRYQIWYGLPEFLMASVLAELEIRRDELVRTKKWKELGEVAALIVVLTSAAPA